MLISLKLFSVILWHFLFLSSIQTESNKADLPEFPIKLALLGKPLCGKTTIISQLEKSNCLFFSFYNFNEWLLISIIIIFLI